MPQIFTFQTTLLSGQKFSPTMLGQSLSAHGVNTISLSTKDVGIAFTPILSGRASAFISTTVEGSSFTIDNAYSGSVMSLVKNDGNFTLFKFVSAGGTNGVSGALSANYRDVSTSETRRKRNLGY